VFDRRLHLALRDEQFLSSRARIVQYGSGGSVQVAEGDAS
jgi:hypothetical protein